MHASTTGSEPSLEPSECSELEFDQLAAALGESPETVISVGMLMIRRCRAVRVGPVERPHAIAIQDRRYPDEPTLYGRTAEAIAALIPKLEGWTCINIAPRFASQLSALVELSANATSVRRLDDVYFQLDDPKPIATRPDVRLLTSDDASLLRRSSATVVSDDVDGVLETISRGHVAAAIVDDQVVAFAHTFMTSRRYADVGVVTHEDHRGQGYATSAASLVSAAVIVDGRTPVWSCGSTNFASIRVAEKLGFREVSRRLYLIPVPG